MNIKQKLQSLISAANQTTGETSTDVTEAVQALVDGYGGGGSVDAAFIKKTQYYNNTSGSFVIFHRDDLISAGILTESTNNIKDLWETCTLMVYASYNTGAPLLNVTTPNKVLNLTMQYPCATYGDNGECYYGNIEYTTSTGTAHSAGRQNGEWINVTDGTYAYINTNGNVQLKASSSCGYIANYTAYLICTGRKTP